MWARHKSGSGWWRYALAALAGSGLTMAALTQGWLSL